MSVRELLNRTAASLGQLLVGIIGTLHAVMSDVEDDRGDENDVSDEDYEGLALNLAHLLGHAESVQQSLEAALDDYPENDNDLNDIQELHALHRCQAVRRLSVRYQQLRAEHRILRRNVADYYMAQIRHTGRQGARDDRED